MLNLLVPVKMTTAPNIHTPSSPQYRFSTPWAYPVDDLPVQSTPIGTPAPVFEPLSPHWDGRSATDGGGDGDGGPPVLAPIDTTSRQYGEAEETTLSGTTEDRRSIDTPILVSPERASDYAKMSMSSATPPPSDVSLNTYFSRLVDLVKKIQRMPWMGGDRVTVDYYPGGGGGKKRERDDLYDRGSARHVTSVSWKSRSYIAWRQSNYGYIGSGGESGGGLASVSEGYGRWTPRTVTTTTTSVDSATAIIEPFPYSNTNNI